jgi:TRAP-type transport system periplasmic protein
MKARAMGSFVAGCVILLSLCVAMPSFGAESVVRLKYADHVPPTHLISILTQQWCKELEKRTNGRITVAYFPVATLVPPAQTYDGVVKGIIDIGSSLMSYTPGRMPLSEVLTLALGFKSGAQASRTANAFLKKFNPKEFDDTKMFYITAFCGGWFHTKTPVNRMEDLKGLRIKGDGYTSKIISALGGAPTTMPMMETYDALKRGLAEGALTPLETLKGWKFGEVCKYTYRNDGAAYANGMFTAMNKERWNSLPADLQQSIAKLNEEWFEKQAKVWKEIDDDAMDYVLKQGHKFVTASPDDIAKTKEMLKPLFDAYLKNTKEKGLPGEEALRFCQDYLKTAPVN